MILVFLLLWEAEEELILWISKEYGLSRQLLLLLLYYYLLQYYYYNLRDFSFWKVTAAIEWRRPRFTWIGVPNSPSPFLSLIVLTHDLQMDLEHVHAIGWVVIKMRSFHTFLSQCYLFDRVDMTSLYCNCHVASMVLSILFYVLC